MSVVLVPAVEIEELFTMWIGNWKFPNETCRYLKLLFKKKQLLLSKVVIKLSLHSLSCPKVLHSGVLWGSNPVLIANGASLGKSDFSYALTYLLERGLWTLESFHSQQAARYGNSFQTQPSNVRDVLVPENFHNQLPVPDELCHVSCCSSVFSCILSCEKHHLKFSHPFSLFRAISYYPPLTFCSKKLTFLALQITVFLNFHCIIHSFTRFCTFIF